MIVIFLLKIFNWTIGLSEIWSILIPLYFFKKQPKQFTLVVFYLCISLLINILINTIWLVNIYGKNITLSNNFLYNILSVLRFYLFSAFFLKLNQPFLKRIKKVIIIVFSIFLIINFGFYENFFDFNIFSSRLLAFEAFCLLAYTLQYYLYEIKNDSGTRMISPEFWMVTGLGIYTSFNFFLFLMFRELTLYFSSVTIDGIWNFHNISYIIFNMLIAKTLHENRKLIT
jgi:hypothetical protein